MGPRTRAGIDPTLPPGRPARNGPPRSVRHPDELDLLAVAGHGLLLDVPEARDVVLLLPHAGVDLRARLLGQQGALEGAGGHLDGATLTEDAGLVEGVARVVLLAVGVAPPRVAGHDDPRLRPVDSTLP